MEKIEYRFMNAALCLQLCSEKSEALKDLISGTASS